MIRAVASSAVERSGALVIRMWFEPGPGGGLRARITATTDLSERDETVTVSSSRDGIIAAVSVWIDAFMSETR
jgi:hypothetical protein